MSFLSGIFLAALPAIAIPVLIHLYRGRQRDVIPWGAMQFLTQAATKGRSMERLEEWLLLALRVGAIVALIMALARPMVRSTWWGGGVASEVVLLVDDSLSMSRTIDGYSSWDRLKENVAEVVNGLDRSDRVQLMLASAGGQWLTGEGVVADNLGKSRIATLLEEVSPTLGVATLLDGLQRVIYVEDEGKTRTRRLVVFTDQQANSWQLDEEGIWRQLEELRKNAEIPTAIEVVDCGHDTEEMANLAVMQLESSRNSIQPGEPIELVATIENVGNEVSPSTSVQWLVDGEEESRTELEALQPKQTTQIKTTLRLQKHGNYAVGCRIDWQDQIDLDQHTSVVVEVADRLPILLVCDRELSNRSKSAEDLLLASLGYSQGEEQDWHSVYYPKVITSQQLSAESLSNYRCVVIENLGQTDTANLERLTDYVTNGGGLWLALGTQTEREIFNGQWYQDRQGLSPVSIAAVKTVPDTNEPAGMIHPPEKAHPATMQLANTTQLDIDQARLYEHWQLAMHEDQAESISVLLESGDGSPLAVENLYGQGRLIVQAFPLGLEWTNLPQLKSYVVMVHDWLDYLTAGSVARYNLLPGNAIVATPPLGATFASAVLLTPTEKEMQLASQATGDGAEIYRFGSNPAARALSSSVPPG